MRSTLNNILLCALNFNKGLLDLSVQLVAEGDEHFKSHIKFFKVVQSNGKEKEEGEGRMAQLSMECKYLTAQDTCGTPTQTKHKKTLARLGNLQYLQPRYTIKVNSVFSVSCIE